MYGGMTNQIRITSQKETLRESAAGYGAKKTLTHAEKSGAFKTHLTRSRGGRREELNSGRFVHELHEFLIR
jgi:hypothetical protein